MARVIFGAVAVLVVILTVPAQGMSSSYRYFGLRWLAAKPVARHIRLDTSVARPISHVAVYIGAENHTITAWVQGGVYRDSFDGRPQAYVEQKNGSFYSLRHWPVAYHEKVRVALARIGSYWQVAVTVGTRLHISKFIPIRPAVFISATGELWGPATGTGHIDRRLLRP